MEILIVEDDGTLALRNTACLSVNNWVFTSWLISQSSTPVEGVLQVRLINRCELDIYDKPLQPFRTVVISCPRMDMIRVWPLPIQHPWFEDWWEPVEGLENARILPNVLET